MTKEALRKEYKAKRAALHSSDRLRMDDLLLLQFQQFDFSDIETLFSYWPIDTHGEPNTHLFSGYLRHMVPGLTIAYPVTDENSISMTALAIHEDTVYRTNEWGITEPKEGYVLLPEQIDLVLVPLLVFDQAGYRVGYGKGFYDRYLSRCRKEVISIGFSYFDPVEKITDTDQFDVPLSYCITPQKTYEF
jgi:5-formyltetrahydrofolate cyclo-ligase